jgi:hypothetical protein
LSSVGGFKRCTIVACAAVVIQNINDERKKLEEIIGKGSDEDLKNNKEKMKNIGKKRGKGYFTVIKTLVQILPDGAEKKSLVCA